MWQSLVDKGIGGLLAPGHKRRMDRAETEGRVHDLLKMAEAKRDADLIAAGKLRLSRDGAPLRLEAAMAEEMKAQLVAPDSEAGSRFPANAAIAKAIYDDAFRRELNVAKAILAAEALIQEEDPDEPDVKPSEDWLYRWRDGASQVSDQDMHDLWGQVLAGEFKSPGRFSLRSLEFMKGISQEEAALIDSLSEFVFDGSVYHETKEFNKAYPDLTPLLWLQELRLIEGVGSIGLGRNFGPGTEGAMTLSLECLPQCLLVDFSSPEQTIHIPVYQVTKMGKEIFSLSTAAKNMEHFRQVGLLIKLKGVKVRLLRKFRRVGANKINFDDADVVVL